jgi:hypothetical protein
MKRDMDLVRHILMTSREADTHLSYIEFSTSDNRWPKECILYHMEIMDEHGLIDASITKAMGGVYFDGYVHRLTWEGQDFCDSIADDRIWSKVKDLIKKGVGSASLQVTVSAITRVANELLGQIPIGT